MVPGAAGAQTSPTISGVGTWFESTDYGSASGTSGSSGLALNLISCAAWNLVDYCVGGFGAPGPSGLSSDVFYAPMAMNGFGAWTQTTDYGASSGSAGTGGVPINAESCVTSNGYIYCVGGQTYSGGKYAQVSDVFFAPLSPTGVGAWTETTDYGAASGTTGSGGLQPYGPSCVASGGYVYCVGNFLPAGKGSATYYAQLSSSGIGPWTETTDYGAPSGTSGSGGVTPSFTSCTANNGYIYCVGGYGSTVYYAPLSSTGIGAWAETTDYGATTGSTGSGGIKLDSSSCGSIYSYIMCVGGRNASASGDTEMARVYYAPVSSTGVGGWNRTTDFGDPGPPVEVSHSAWVAAQAQAKCAAAYHVGAGSGGKAGSKTYVAPFKQAGSTCSSATTTTSTTTVVETSPTSTTTIVESTSPTSASTTVKTTPTLTTHLFEWITSGANVSIPQNGNIFAAQTVVDTSTLTGTTPNPTGTITYARYNGGSCSGTGTPEGTVNVAGSKPSYPSMVAYQSTVGTFSFQAVYSGDPQNGPATSSCEVFNVVPQSVGSTTEGTSTGIGVGVGVGIPWTWIGIGIGIILIGILLWLFRWRKPKTPPEEGTEEGTEPGTEPGYCTPSTEWHLDRFNLSAIPGEEENPSGAPSAVMKHYKVTKPAKEPMPISAASEDMHALVYGCTCEEKTEKKLVFVYAVEKFDWEVSLGGGGFIRITGGHGKRTESGEQVIYAPPDIPEGKTHDVKIQVKATHKDATKSPNHGPIILGLDLKITHAGKDYVWEFYPASTAQMANEKTTSDFFDPNAAWRWTDRNLQVHLDVPCLAYGKFEQTKEIEGLIAATLYDKAASPKALDRESGECAPGDYVRFEFKGDDMDHFLIDCVPQPTSDCARKGMSIPMLDPLRCEWSSTRGNFVKSISKYSNVAIWHAPTEEGVVEIQVRVSDSKMEFNDKDYILGTRVTVRKK